MKALHRRWKLALAVAILASGGAIVFLPLAPALAGGAVLGVGLAVLLECLDRTIKTVDDVSGKLGLTVFAPLPRFAPAPGAAGAPERQLLTGLPADHPSVQAFQGLCRRLSAEPGSRPGQVIMVTSCIPGEGKSTVSGNLAASLGQSGASVLLIGCDLRRPTLGGMFSQPEEPGLTELLVAGDQSALRKLSVPAIDFIPGGSIPDNPADLLNTKLMRDLLEFARTRYDYVVLDAPPILPVTDGQLLAPQSDVLLAVMEPCRTQLDMARQLIESLRAVGREIDGVVLNDRSGLAARYYGFGQDHGEEVKSVATSRSSAAPWNWAAAAVALAAVAIGASWWLALNSQPEVAPARSLPPVAGLRGPDAAPPPVPGRAVARTESQSLAASAGQPATTARGAADGSPPPAPPTSRSGPVNAAENPPLPAVVTRAAPPPGTIPAKATVEAAPQSFVQSPASVTREPAAAVVPATALPAVSPDGLQPALAALASSWRKPLPTGLAGGTPQEWFAAMGLQGSPIADDLAVLLQLNTPLLIESRQEQAGTAWLAVVGRKGFKWLVSPRTTRGDLLSETELKQLWTGKGYLPSQDPLRLADLDERAAPPDQVARLQQLLVKAGTLQQFQPGVFDRETIKAIGHLQATNGLRVNGRITPETLVLLYQTDPVFLSPKFTLWQ